MTAKKEDPKATVILEGKEMSLENGARAFIEKSFKGKTMTEKKGKGEESDEEVEERATGIVEVVVEPKSDVVHYRGDYFGIDISKTALKDLFEKDSPTRRETLIRKFKLLPKKMKNKDGEAEDGPGLPQEELIGNWYKRDLTKVISTIEGNPPEVVGSRGATIEQVVEKVEKKKGGGK